MVIGLSRSPLPPASTMAMVFLEMFPLALVYMLSNPPAFYRDRSGYGVYGQVYCIFSEFANN